MSVQTSPLAAALRATFSAHFGTAAQWLVRAPGRVNLIGEHTDYNDGFVLPCAIDFHTLVAAAARGDMQVRVLAADLGHAVDSFRLDATIRPNPQAPWANYVRGVARELLQDGWALQGIDLAISGNVPQGAGLSSSAALEVAVATALQQRSALDGLTPPQIARIAQRAENQFVGCHCGVMDQLVSACGQAGHALLIDCRTLALQPVPLPAGVAVMIVHSKVQRGLVDSAYNSRRAQCEAAARHLGVTALRDATLHDLASRGAGLDAVVQRRARHVISENSRTLTARDALAAGDLAAMGRLMAASHTSMRDDFEITVPAIDQLVDILQQAIGPHGGARMTGGGFGGCVVALLPTDQVPAVQAAVARHYRAPDGQPGTVHVCQAQAGAGMVG